MNHSFNVKLAEKTSITRAILLNNLDFWIDKNAANKSNYNKGAYWTYNSAKAFSILFPYMSQSTIARDLKELESEGYIKSSKEFNKSKYDHTKWYSLTDKYYTFINKENPSKTHSNNDNADSQNERTTNQNELTTNQIKTTIPDINTNINTDTLSKEKEERENSKKYVNIANRIVDWFIVNGYTKKPFEIRHKMDTKRAVTTLVDQGLSVEEIETELKAYVTSVAKGVIKHPYSSASRLIYAIPERSFEKQLQVWEQNQKDYV